VHRGEGVEMNSHRVESAPFERSAFAAYRFPPEIILLAVRWYLRYGLSYRDVEELLAGRGVEVDHVTIYRWVQRFTSLLIDAARPCRHAAGGRWFVDETYVKVAGKWRYVYRAVDHGTARSSTCSCPLAATFPLPADSSVPRWPLTVSPMRWSPIWRSLWRR